MIVLTAPGRGQIVSHNLYKEPELIALRSRYDGHAASGADFDDEESGRSPDRHAPASASPAAGAREASAGMLTKLAADVAELQAEVTRLRERIRDLEAKLEAVRG